MTLILKEQLKEIKQIKNSLNALIEQTKPKRMGAYLYSDCGYEWMFVQIKLPAETWMQIKTGERVKVAGNDWVPEEVICLMIYIRSTASVQTLDTL